MHGMVPLLLFRGRLLGWMGHPVIRIQSRPYLGTNLALGYSTVGDWCGVVDAFLQQSQSFGLQKYTHEMKINDTLTRKGVQYPSGYRWQKAVPFRWQDPMDPNADRSESRCHSAQWHPRRETQH
jgi:hypothetical protein